jgi:hypothetical protein
MAVATLIGIGAFIWNGVNDNLLFWGSVQQLESMQNLLIAFLLYRLSTHPVINK